jgi:hypothetical protein
VAAIDVVSSDIGLQNCEMVSPMNPSVCRTIILAALTLLSSCGHPSPPSVSPPNSRIDNSKIIDFHASVPLAIRITIFTYRDADSLGWPSADSHQKYVRFLQDRDIHVGFLLDRDSGLYCAMIDGNKVDAAVAADKDAAAVGVEKPPMVPDSQTGNYNSTRHRHQDRLK